MLAVVKQQEREAEHSRSLFVKKTKPAAEGHVFFGRTPFSPAPTGRKVGVARIKGRGVRRYLNPQRSLDGSRGGGRRLRESWRLTEGRNKRGGLLGCYNRGEEG